MIIIAETTQENALAEKLARENHGRAIAREDGYAVTVWSVDDVAGYKKGISREGAKEFLEDFENRLKDAAVEGGFLFIEEADADNYVLLSENAEYELVECCDKRMLFANERVYPWQVPEGLHLYHLRESDDGSRFVSIETRVVVNHGGSLLSREPIDLGPNGYIALTEDTEPNFLGCDDVSIRDYIDRKEAAE